MRTLTTEGARSYAERVRRQKRRCTTASAM
jgi:hypothetical protein